MCRLSISNVPLPTFTKEPTLEELNKQQPKARDEAYRSKLKSRYKSEDVDFEKLHRVVQSDYRLYSAGTFETGFAKNDNWRGQELLILDIDDGLPLSEALELFSDYKAMIHTSTSHQKDKGGLKCDRYRVIIKTKEPINCTAKEYTKTMKMIVDRKFPFVDEKCVDPARIYFGYADSEIFYTGGQKLFDFEEQIRVMNHLEFMQVQQQQAKKPMKTYDNSDSVITQFNADNTVESILSRNGYKQQGKRWVSPTSSTGMAGVVIMESEDGISRAYSHHSSDDWEVETAFGLYAILEHSGDMKRAVESLKAIA